MEFEPFIHLVIFDVINALSETLCVPFDVDVLMCKQDIKFVSKKSSWELQTTDGVEKMDKSGNSHFAWVCFYPFTISCQWNIASCFASLNQTPLLWLSRSFWKLFKHRIWEKLVTSHSDLSVKAKVVPVCGLRGLGFIWCSLGLLWYMFVKYHVT